MEDGFNVVSVGADDERCVVAPAVLWTHSGSTVVLGSGIKRGAVEVLDLLPGLCREGQVEMSCLFFDSANAQRGWIVGTAQFYAKRPLRDDLYAKRRQSLDEEVSGFFVVADREDDVIEHRCEVDCEA